MFVCAGNNETFPFAVPVGVGLIESTINLTRLVLFDRPDFLIFVGTAGSYGKYQPFDIVESSIASNIELAFWEKRAYTPIDNVIEAYRDEAVSRETMPIVNSSNYITTDKTSWNNFRKHRIELENMEFFAVLKISQEFTIPVHGIFVVTNYCDQNAHTTFLQNHERAKQRLTEYIYDKYEALKQ